MLWQRLILETEINQGVGLKTAIKSLTMMIMGNWCGGGLLFDPHHRPVTANLLLAEPSALLLTSPHRDISLLQMREGTMNGVSQLAQGLSARK
jgi:hypothetical protein